MLLAALPEEGEDPEVPDLHDDPPDHHGPDDGGEVGLEEVPAVEDDPEPARSGRHGWRRRRKHLYIK